MFFTVLSPRAVTLILAACVGISLMLAWQLLRSTPAAADVWMFHLPGEAILLSLESGHLVVVDSGETPQLADKLAELLPLWQRTIDVLILTHADQDHVGGSLAMLDHFQVGSIFLPGAAEDSLLYNTIIKRAKARGVAVIYASATTDIKSGDEVIDIVFPQASLLAQAIPDRHDTSLILRYRNPETAFLFTGDAEAKHEADLLTTPARLTSTVLKVPHHGSKTSSSPALLAAVQPDIALNSAHADNRFGHPHSEIVDRYHATDIPLFNTGDFGDIRLSTLLSTEL